MADLSLMTWNVRYFSQGTGGLRATQGGIARIASALARQSTVPAILALQEVETRSLRAGYHAQPQLDRFVDALSAALTREGHPIHYRALYYPAHRYAMGPAALYTTGLAMLVSDELEIVDHNAATPHDITHVRLPGLQAFKQRRIAAHVRVQQPSGEQLDLFNTHLSLPAFLEVGPHRVPSRMGHGSNQLIEAQRLLAFASEKRGAHAVVMGDFNSLPGSPVHQHIVASGWVDATPPEQRSIGTAAFLDRRMAIDHVFSTPGVRWSALTTHPVDQGPFSGLSDHAPKTGVLSFL